MENMENARTNPSLPDRNADKTGTDKGADHTQRQTEKPKFDKPNREVNPDTTGIDTDTDSTKKSNGK